MKKKKKQQQQQQQDDIIDYILEYQEELLDEKYISIIRNAMRRIPFDVIDTIASDRNVRFFTITDQFYAVVKNLIDPYSAIPPEERGVTPSVNWQLIMINDMLMNKLNPEDKQAVIAHELAHGLP
jgi:Zn-dependent protease with chaperone function